jgi:2-aminoadipate transaminase
MICAYLNGSIEQYAAFTQIPPVREANPLKSHASSPNDSATFLSQRAIHAAGQPIGKLMAQALRFPHLISLAAGFVDNATLPCEAASRTLNALASDEVRLRKSLQYGTTAGLEELRHSIIDWSYSQWPQHGVTTDRMLLASGSNQLLHLLAETILDPGDIVIAAAPTYFVFLGTLRSMGARTIGVHADQDGMCMQALRRQLEQLAVSGQAKRVKAIYCITDFDNPGGSTLSFARRREMLAIVEDWRSKHGPLLIISDSAYQHLRYDGDALPPMLSLSDTAAEFVVDLGTFSKVFSPGIRVGWGVFPRPLIEPLDIRSNIDFGAPHLNQSIVHGALASGELESHLPTICNGYRIKRDAMLAALDQHMADMPGVHWEKPAGGMYVWLRLPEHIDTSEQGELWQLATQHGVLYVPGHHCYPAEGQKVERNTMRLSFGVQSPESIRTGIGRLAEAIEELVGLTSR